MSNSAQLGVSGDATRSPQQTSLTPDGNYIADSLGTSRILLGASSSNIGRTSRTTATTSASLFPATTLFHTSSGHKTVIDELKSDLDDILDDLNLIIGYRGSSILEGAATEAKAKPGNYKHKLTTFKGIWNQQTAKLALSYSKGMTLCKTARI